MTPPMVPVGSESSLWSIALWPLISGFVVTVVVVPVVRGIARAWNLYDRPDSGLKPHARPIPYLGGVAVYVGWLASLHTAMVLFPPSREKLPWVAIAGTILMLTGLVDDLRGLRPVMRLLIQAGAAGVLLYRGIGRDFTQAVFVALFGSAPQSALVGCLVTAAGGLCCIIILAGATNATNLVDGLDGLCAGILAIAALGFLAVAANLSRTLTSLSPDLLVQAALAAALLGPCAAFLLYNFNPASIFMGDSGALLLGFSVAAILIGFGEQSSWRWLVSAVVVFGFPVFDTALAIARRALNGRPLFVGDRSHFYDQVRDRGFSVKRTVLICYLLGLLFALLGTLLLRLPLAGLVAVLIACPLLLAVVSWRLGLLRVDDAAQRSGSPAADVGVTPAAPSDTRQKTS